MDEFTRDLAHGQAGLGKIEAAMSGNLGAAAEYAAIEEATGEPQRRARPALSWTDRPLARPGADRPLIPYRTQGRLLALVAVVLVVLALIWIT